MKMERRFVQKGMYALFVLFIGFALMSCSDDDDEKIEKTINGYWKLGKSWCVKVEGNQGVLVLFDDTHSEYKDYNKFVKLGDVVMKDLKKVDDNLWTGQEVGFFVTTEGEVLRIEWLDATYEMNAAGTELTRHVAGKSNQAYHRVQQPTDEY